jgi:chromosome segregation ATPase
MDVQRLAKVLALAASDNDAEALHALRTAKRLLDGAGHDFVSLAEKLANPFPAAATDHAAEIDTLENAVFDLRNEVRHLRAENEKLRQARPAPPPQPPATLAGAAQDAAAAIRLRAELAAAQDALDAERAEVARHTAIAAELARDLAQSRSDAARALARLDEVDSRRARLEVEVKRLTIEREAARRVVEVAAPRVAPPAAKPARARRPKAAAQQMALL